MKYFIGLEKMGAAIAANISKAEYELTFWNRSPGLVAVLEKNLPLADLIAAHFNEAVAEELGEKNWRAVFRVVAKKARL